MKRLFSAISFILILMPMIIILPIIGSSTENDYLESDEIYQTEEVYTVSKISDDLFSSVTVDKTLKGIWLTQFDMTVLYRDGSKQREVKDFTEKSDAILQKISEDGFNTLFLQLRPNGDSIYESKIYPLSKYIAGYYGGTISYDAVGIFLDIAKKYGLSVHAWINPYRLSSSEETEGIGDNERIKTLYRNGIAKACQDGLLYLDPSYDETTRIIVDGAEEILTLYDFDGIHLDDYFYPTEFEFDDEKEYRASGYDNKGEFRRSNTEKTVKALYNLCRKHDKLFGISPAGNIYSLTEGWYIDIYKWISEYGYVDYIMPQLYYGFDNAVCPFDKILTDWENAVTATGIDIYIGLSAAKCCIGSEGGQDIHAGESGKYEWRDNKDIISREIEIIVKSEKASGYCIFCCSSLYDMLSATDNPLIAEEKALFSKLIKEY